MVVVVGIVDKLTCKLGYLDIQGNKSDIWWITVATVFQLDFIYFDKISNELQPFGFLVMTISTLFLLQISTISLVLFVCHR